MTPGRGDALRPFMRGIHHCGPALSMAEATAPVVPANHARRLRLALTTWIATGSMVLSTGPVLAAPSRMPRWMHAPAMVAGSHHASFQRSAHVRHARPGAAHGRATRATATAVHPDVVPLANTTWDHPTLPPPVLAAVRDAARESGIDPALLMAIAWRESRFDPRARNRRSSAQGLLQFTSGTWLQIIRELGAQHGAGTYAAAIRKQRSGRLTVSDQRLRSEILGLRSDPALSARFAAETMVRQRDAMQARLGRGVAPADLYLLHVLGPSGSARFLDTLARHPSASSLEVASGKTLRNAGLLAYDGRPMTVAGTYVALRVMLDDQRARAASLLAAVVDRQQRADDVPLASGTHLPPLVEVSLAP